MGKWAGRKVKSHGAQGYLMDIYPLLSRVREKKPLVHHITNWVTIYECAAITRAAGALPIMAHAEEEAAEMTGISGALVLNIGTLTPQIVRSMVAAGRKANEKKLPVILDAVGAGATKLRTGKANEIMRDVKLAVIKGNRSEIGTLAGAKAETKGVEAISVEGKLEEIARKLAKKSGAAVVITGKRDIVAGPSGEVYFIDNGHEMMGKVVGTGCMAGSMIGAFCAVEKDHAKAAAAALSCFGIAGELAAKRAKAPMAFRSALIDEVYSLGKEEVGRMSRVEVGK